ncbi:hypothetical protein WJX74_005562 [Apatococcus lobatus]|uniref:Uncharacterized protein n=1 Tax=Apatococcus lobatus TaxID=904363 RepID=A0AAW1R167_9CHLO
MALSAEKGSDLRNLSKYFDSLVDLVPPQFYHDSPHEHLNLKYLKKSERAAVKRQFKEDYKKNKRAKLDPAQAQTSIGLQQQKAQQQEAQKEGAEGASSEEDEDGPSALGADLPSQNGKAGRIMKLAADGERPSMDALRDRLHQRIQVMRDQRNADQQGEQVRAAQEWRDKAGAKGRQKLIAVKNAPAAAQRVAAPAAAASKQHLQQQQAQRKQGGQAAAEPDLQFGRLDVDGSGGQGRQRGAKRKADKVHLLAEAEQRQAGSSQAGPDGMMSAMARARGEKVLDDPKLLRRSIKKDIKQREHKAKAWRERESSQKASQKAQQQRRKENLKGRVDAKMQKKKDKREKKLMVPGRAGFEGRRTAMLGKKATP